MTTADYLNKLVTQKNTLADNLVEKGVEATHEETLETLIPKVLEIDGGGAEKQLGIYPVGTDGRPTGNVIIPDCVTTIHEELFEGNNNITSIQLPESVTSLSNYAFYQCKNLKSVQLPSGITKINDFCFRECDNLTDVTSSSDTISLGNYAFCDCLSLTNQSATAIASKAVNNGSMCFASCNALTDVTVYHFSHGFFANCPNLTTVTITGSISGSHHFHNCVKLQQIIFTNEALDNIEIPQSFCENCSSLNNIIIPDKIEQISDYAFMGCSNLPTINIPESVTYIKYNAFYNCNSLSNVVVADNAAFEIGASAFSTCSSLTDTDVSNIISHATTISNNVFEYCTGLKNVTVTLCNDKMFYRCTNLQTVVIDVNGRTGDDVFLGCEKLVEAELKSCTTIGISLFYDCVALKKVILPSTITTATDSSLTSTSDSYYFLKGCTALEECIVGTDWNMSLRLNVSENLTVDGMVNLMNNLKDLTGDTANTLTLGEINLAKLTDEQKAIAINKNWTLA